MHVLNTENIFMSSHICKQNIGHRPVTVCNKEAQLMLTNLHATRLEISQGHQT